MDHLTETWKKIRAIIDKDARYKEEAYSFVMAALEESISKLSQVRHVSAAELLEGIKHYAIRQFGPMAKEVFNFWGITTTEDFGNIVFNLIDAGLLSKTEQDCIEDFAVGYDFRKIFEEDYFKR
ncbi:MAG: hypothetical protein JSV33_07130 [bacterium]|nr:MAG: hypothetical protein JSV33_07130 [bacterium]